MKSIACGRITIEFDCSYNIDGVGNTGAPFTLLLKAMEEKLGLPLSPDSTSTNIILSYLT